MQQPALKRVLVSIASLRLTAVGIALLIACVLGSYLSGRTGSSLGWSGWLLAVPLGLLAINLAAAILVDPRINRRPGLLVFHVALLSIFALGAYGELTGFHGRIELVTGQAFESAAVVPQHAGPLHTSNLDAIEFVQGDIRVAYASDIIRQETLSTVSRSGSGAPETFGDNVPLSSRSYDLYTTSNNGIAAVVVWTARGAPPRMGAIHFPSYPLNEWRQYTRWQPEPDTDLTVALNGLAPLNPDAAFVLDEALLEGVALTIADRTLRPGETIDLPGGQLRFEELRLWMGYEIRSAPMTLWIFLCALAGICGIGWYFLTPGRTTRAPAASVAAPHSTGLRVRSA